MANSSKTPEPTPTSPLSTPDDERSRESKKVFSQCHERMKRFYKSVPVVTGAAVPNVQFINLATVERPSYRAKREKDVHDFVHASIHGIDGYYRQSKKLDYKDILRKPLGRFGKRVLITGAPGCGKTTLSRQLCKDLYTKDLDNEYQLVFLVELRRLKVGLDSVEEDIDLQYLLKDFKRTLDLPSLCQELKDSDGEGVALILDGYDEIADRLGNSPFLSDLLSVGNPYLNQCDVFVTTRPSRCSDVMSLIQQPHHHVEILGFTDSNIDSYIDSFFRGIYGDRSQGQAKSQKVIHRLKSLYLVRGMCRIPRVLEIVCKVQDRLGDDPLPKTLSLIFSKYICYQLLDYLNLTGKRVSTKIKHVLQIPEDLFPGFNSLCEVAYKCCIDERGQRLILTDDDLGDLKQYLDERGSVYSLLFSEYIDEECTDEGVLYQFNHKTVMETLAAVYIAEQNHQDQELIWKNWFAVPEMGEVWRVYCGLTRLEHVDLLSLSLPSLSEHDRELMDNYDIQDDHMLVMMSLYESDNIPIAGQTLQALLKRAIYAHIGFAYDSQIVTYSVKQHPNLQKVGLTFPQNLSESDLELNESIRTVKAVELKHPPVETVLSVLSGPVEEFTLTLQKETLDIGGGGELLKTIGNASRINPNLRSLHFEIIGRFYHAPLATSVMIEDLCRNERLTELTVNTACSLKEVHVKCLKSLLLHRVKCALHLTLSYQQWCSVLSGLKDAKDLKELCIHMQSMSNYLISKDADYNQSDEHILSCEEVQDLIATHEQLVKVVVGCSKEMLIQNDVEDNLMLAIMAGVFTSKRILELGITFSSIGRRVYQFDHISPEVIFLSLAGLANYADHITCVRFTFSNYTMSSQTLAQLLAVVEVDTWCDLLEAGPMSRPVCHLTLDLIPAECGLLLSRVHNAELMEQLTLKISCVNVESPACVDVQAVEGALSNCRLRKLRIDITSFLHNPDLWYDVCGAVLRGVANNRTYVDFVICGVQLSDKRLMSQLPPQFVGRFKVVKRKTKIYIISKPCTPTGSVQRSLTSEESTSEVEALSVQGPTVRKKRSPPPPSSRVLRSHVSTKLPATSPSPPSPPSPISSLPPPSPPTTSRAKRSRLSSVPKKPVKSRAKALPSTSQQLQASQEPSSVEGVIKDTSFFLPYMDKMLPHLLVLGTALEVEDYTVAVLNAPGALEDQCLKVLKKWLNQTPNPTLREFCEKLKKAQVLNSLRETIEGKEL